MSSLDAALSRFVDAPEVPGIVACRISPDAEVSLAAAGYLSRTGQTAMPLDATFRIASSTKTFTAAAVLRLIERGQLRLSDVARDYLPDEIGSLLHLSDGKDRGSEISLLHLLQHSSGLRDMNGQVFYDIIFGQPHKRWSPWEKIDLSLRTGPPVFDPGTTVAYCDIGYVVLAMVLEAVTKRPIAESFRELLKFDRLGLTSLHLESLEEVPPGSGPRARHYLGERDVSDIDPSCDLWGAGGLVSNAQDLARWWHALFHGYVFDDGRTLTLMRQSQPEPLANRDMGLGLYRRTVSGHSIWAHGGAWGTYPVYDETSGMTLAIMATQGLDYLPGPGFRDLIIELLTA